MVTIPENTTLKHLVAERKWVSTRYNCSRFETDFKYKVILSMKTNSGIRYISYNSAIQYYTRNVKFIAVNSLANLSIVLIMY